MIDLATAAAAAMLSNSVSAIDKLYNWWSTSRGGREAKAVLRDNPQASALSIMWKIALLVLL